MAGGPIQRVPGLLARSSGRAHGSAGNRCCGHGGRPAGRGHQTVPGGEGSGRGAKTEKLRTIHHQGSYFQTNYRSSCNGRIFEDGYDIRTVQELLGHTDVSTTMIYTHVLNRGGRGVNSPADRLRWFDLELSKRCI